METQFVTYLDGRTSDHIAYNFYIDVRGFVETVFNHTQEWEKTIHGGLRNTSNLCCHCQINSLLDKMCTGNNFIHIAFKFNFS